MTNQEAIVILRGIEYDIMPNDGITRTESVAFDLAIKALKKIDLIKFNIHALNELIEEADNEAD